MPIWCIKLRLFRADALADMSSCLPKEDRMLVTKQELLDKVTGLLGGRVAEELFIGEIGTGAYSDFQQATGIVRSMIMEYGMSDKLGPMQFGSSQGQVFLGRDIGHEQNYSDSIAYEIDPRRPSRTIAAASTGRRRAPRARGP